MPQIPAKSFKLNVKEPRIVSIIILSAFASMGAILITPALPTIALYFHLSDGTAQLTVTSFLLGYAVGQLLYGPLANRLGRKPAFYIGIAIATLGSLFSILSSPLDSFPLMIFGRFLEALGSSVGLVICFTIINDFYYPQQARKIVGLMMLAFAIVPGVATALGGLLTQHISWQSCFYFLFLYGLVLLYPAATLPETITQRDPNALQSRYLAKNYWAMLKNKKLMSFSIIFGLSTACAYIFSAEGPFIGIHLLGFSPATYGLIGLTPCFGALLGSLLTVKLSNHFSSIALLGMGIALEISGALLMLGSFIGHSVNAWTLLLPVGILLTGHTLLCANVSILALEDTDDKANGSAIMSFTNIGMAVLTTFTLGMLHSSNILTMPLIFIGCLVLMMLTYFISTQT